MSAEIIEFEKKEHDPVCNFCKAKKSKSKKFVEYTNGKCVCGVCIEKLKKLVNGDGK